MKWDGGYKLPKAQRKEEPGAAWERQGIAEARLPGDCPAIVLAGLVLAIPYYPPDRKHAK